MTLTQKAMNWVETSLLISAMCMLMILGCSLIGTALCQAAEEAPKDAVQAAAKAGDAATVQQAVQQNADKLTPEQALSVLDNLRQRARFDGTLADHVVLQQAVTVLKDALTELEKEKKEVAELKQKYEPKKAEDQKEGNQGKAQPTGK